MKVKEVIEKLTHYNPEADMSVVVHNFLEQFSITWGGGGEGETQRDCKAVNFYVDRICQGEEKTTR